MGFSGSMWLGNTACPNSEYLGDLDVCTGAMVMLRTNFYDSGHCVENGNGREVIQGTSEAFKSVQQKYWLEEIFSICQCW